MLMKEFIYLFGEQLVHTTWLEWMALCFGVMEVLLARANKIWLYPAGLTGSACSIVLMLEAGLYAEAALCCYYIIMSIYGWWYWKSGNGHKKIAISKCRNADWKVVFFIAFGGWGALYLVLAGFTDSAVPVLDSFVSATAWAGTWLLSRRKLENWLVLNISNAVAIPLLLYKHLPMLALLTLFLFVVAIFGYFDWRKKLNARMTKELALA